MHVRCDAQILPGTSVSTAATTMARLKPLAGECAEWSGEHAFQAPVDLQRIFPVFNNGTTPTWLYWRCHKPILALSSTQRAARVSSWRPTCTRRWFQLRNKQAHAVRHSAIMPSTRREHSAAHSATPPSTPQQHRSLPRKTSPDANLLASLFARSLVRGWKAAPSRRRAPAHHTPCLEHNSTSIT
jgi:hypothetical protein